jgi:hypothetical protein
VFLGEATGFMGDRFMADELVEDGFDLMGSPQAR